MTRSRTARAAKLGAVAGTEAARHAATATANVARSEARAQMAMEARNAQLAERLVIVLGTMRGAPVKLGQMISMLDVGLIPADQREAFQRKLAALQDNAPRAPWSAMHEQLRSELGSDLPELFAEFDEDAVAAASIGQVYRARLHDGREVAVKVRYPGMTAAMRADIRNLRMFLGAYRLFHEGLDAKALADEFEELLLAELDYESEAANTRVIADAYAGHPFIRVPNVVPELCSTRVIVTEWLEGRPLSDLATAPLAQRNRIAEILFRFYAGSPHRTSLYSADPHPGNSLVLDDGSVAFIDFGLCKQVDDSAARAELEWMRAATDGDADRLCAILHERGFIRDLGAVPAPAIHEAYMTVAGWYLIDGDLEITPESVNARVASLTDPAVTSSAAIRTHNLPREHAMRARTELQLAAILGQLRPRINLHVVAREWIYGDAPQTELGRRHLEWSRGRATSRGY